MGFTFLLGVVVWVNCTPPGPPAITSLSPPSGPSGSIVTVAGANFGTGGSVSFDMVAVRSIGTGSPMVFTVPYTAATGAHNVQIQVGSQTSAAVPFQVTSTIPAPVPVVQGYELGYYSVAGAGD